MAIYQWRGSTGSSLNRYDWNHAPNWIVSIYNSSPTVASTPPGAGDQVYVGMSPISSAVCHSPLLYGGFAGSISGGSWSNSGGTGHTFNTALMSISAVVGDPSSIYRFPSLGGGITGLNYEWLVRTGVTAGGMSGQTITLSDSRQNKLNLKVKDANITTKSGGYSTLFFVPNLGQFNGATSATAGSAGSPNAPIANNTLVASNGGTMLFDGGIWESMVLEPDALNGFTANAFTALSNAVCTDLRLKCHSFVIDSSVTAGHVKVDGGHFNPFHRMRFDGNVNMENALRNQYPAGGVSGSDRDGDSTLHLVNPTSFMFRFPFASIAIGNNADLTKTTKVGRIVAETSTEYSQGPEYPCPWSIEFSGNVQADEVRMKQSFMSANPMIPKSASVVINSLYLDKGSILDLGANMKFDNWAIGGPTASLGGIFFEDEHSQVVGSKGQRLWLSQMSLGGRYDSRLSVLGARPLTPNNTILPTETV